MTYNSNTVSVVVGGTSGIGRAIADKLKTRPGRVEITSRRVGFDMTDEANVAAYFDKLGPVDHVIVTAGSAAPGGGVTEVDFLTAKEGFDTKFWGSILVAREASKHIRPGGTITLTSGFLSRKTVPGTFVKTAMNAAIEASAKMLAKELAPIRVNVISPGLTDTDAYAAMADSAREAMLKRSAETLPAGRVGQPENLADGYIFAIDNPFATGAIIDLDGGALLN